MTTPVDERDPPRYPNPAPLYNGNLAPPTTGNTQNSNNISRNDRSSDEEGTVFDEGEQLPAQQAAHLRPPQQRLAIETEAVNGHGPDPLSSMASPSQSREQAYRLDDDLKLLQIERKVSEFNAEQDVKEGSAARGERRRHEEPVDDFDIATNPLHEKTQIYKPPTEPSNEFAKFFKRVHESTVLVRWFTYIVPVVLILLLPLLLGALLFRDSAHVGGVELMWFCVWLEIVWLTLWAGRILAKMLPWPMGLISSVFTNNSKKWRDMGKQLEIPATLFFWWLAIEISFLPTMTYHYLDRFASEYGVARPWMITMNKVLVAFFVGFVLNFIEKIIIQLIAISFHLRTYADRIEVNKFQINSLAKLYQFSKEKMEMEDSEFEEAPSGGPSGARTPGQVLDQGQKAAKEAIQKFGDVAGKIAGDFTGKAVVSSTHPHQVVLSLLSTNGGSQVLARRLYRTFAREETETAHPEDMRNAFDNDNEADAAFSMFDKDMNGDISMEELEAVCVEIGRERKSITASLKDLDSVVSKLDDVFMFLVLVIVILVLISLISTSAAGVLTSAGSAVLALSWLFSATAQEFLQSIIFVFVKHPFDVGDRVGIYGNTGENLQGDDYFVKEIALLYTEFKKMEGHIVQAPNSYLNTLFILNQRRSGGLAEAVPIIVKFGTTLQQIEDFRNRLLEFVKSEKREYQANILTELRKVEEAHSITMNVVFFYKSNWQNELLRLQRRNKFICAMMVSMQELGIEGPRMRYPGQKESFPVYLQNLPHQHTPGAGRNGTPDNPSGIVDANDPVDPPFVPPLAAQPGGEPLQSHASILRNGGSRPRGESLSAMSRRVDFSLGMSSIGAMDMPGDVYEDRENSRPRIPINITSPSRDPAGRKSGSQNQSSSEIARTTSRSDTFGPGNLYRRGTTDSEFGISRTSVHRNRFFGRARHGSADALERGEMTSNVDRGAPMANIPENEKSGMPTENNSPQRIDPRSGLVSPAAVRVSTNESGVGTAAATTLRHELGSANANVEGGKRSVDQGQGQGQQLPPRDAGPSTKHATEDYEMKRLQ